MQPEQHHNWKGDNAPDHAKRMRARRWFKVPEACERCGTTEKRIERHHVDGDPGNNTQANIQFVCRGCHQQIDGRAAQNAARLRALNRVAPPKECSNCGRLYKPLRHGRCGSCALHWRKHGAELDVSRTRKPELVGSSLWAPKTVPEVVAEGRSLH